MMKNLFGDLTEVTTKGHTHHIATSTAAFLAIRDDVEIALGAGYSVNTLWEYFQDKGKFTSSYETFRRHVRKYIRQSNA